MHLQIRTRPITSPPDIEKLLRLLAEAGVSLSGAGGSNIEFGGEFAIALEDGHEDEAIRVLQANRYPHRVLEAGKDPGLTLCWIKDPTKAGELHRCIKGVSDANLTSGRIIRDLLIGVPGPEGTPVQIYSEEIRTPHTIAADPTQGEAY